MEKVTKTSYELDYGQLPFEDILRIYRQQNIIKAMAGSRPKSILEIGCGPQPLFNGFDDFEKMVVIEPLNSFFAEVTEMAGTDTRITLVNDLFENAVNDMQGQVFDFIIVGGFLHEINNPVEVLQATKKVSGPNTMLHSFVPNAHSFHRLLAYEMGLIDTVYQKSGHDEMFERFHVYNIETFRKLFETNGFSVEDIGTYFLKVGTHNQLHEMLSQKIIDNTVIEGLNKMIKYFPNHGAEIYINCQVGSPEQRKA